MNSKQFLVIGGIILVVVGILGWINVLGPTADSSIFGSGWWFDTAENWAHFVLGIVALVVAFLLPASTHKPIVIVVGIIAILAALYNLAGTKLLGANLESPADLILHLVIGLWALYAALNKRKATPTAPNTSMPM
ncbi:MAG TPA: hypothetical protein VI981_05645 [Candidatus Paceibacterota bacterium]